MEAKSVARIPSGREWQYEPKWDGFRCLAFRDGGQVELQSKSGQPLTRYFPEVVKRLKGLPTSRFVLDAELVVPRAGQFSFDDLLQRLHPAASRVSKLAEQTPAFMVVFDILAGPKGESLLEVPLKIRRARLEEFAKKNFPDPEGIGLSPATTDVQQAEKWLHSPGSDLDGIIAKRLDLPYTTEDRGGMQKIKRERSADCVVGGFRYAEKGKLVGSLLLGLYGSDGLLHHVGFCSGIKTSDRPALTKRLEKLVKAPGFTGRAPGGPSRWNTGRSHEWQPLESRLVVEVAYDHTSDERFRHGTRLIRWRPDKAPKQCMMDQLHQKRVRSGLKLLSSLA